ncbi:MAG TPA: DUF4810 domain-containing protein [Candidatus Dormibacteraeota bacterium]|nr:DUF4810 domain-containing protein [Candidatus Dormibacteraeota bacterium]
MMSNRLLVVLLLASTGCSSPSLYSWGHYEDVIYVSYNAPGKMPPERQVEILEADYQKARSANKPVPPGFHAHLGHLYFHLGKYDQARQEFETEKANFPESAVLMNRMLAGLSKK